MELYIHNNIVLIDAKDYPIIAPFNWWLSREKYTSYARSKEGRMHRLILGLTDSNIKVDHINGNGLDNRRENIRMCSISENNRNVIKRISLSSPYKGVSWHKTERKWQAQIKHNKIRKHLGLFNDEIDAAEAYNKWAIILHKEFAVINNIPQRQILQSIK